MTVENAMTAAIACPELSVEEAAELIADGHAIVIDVSPRRRWASGHIPGALNLVPGDFTAGDIPGDEDATLLFYSSVMGVSTCQYAAQRAVTMGFRHVFTMKGGLREWMAAGHRAMSGA
jgi:rhodanese-related sulfurtransferase